MKFKTVVKLSVFVSVLLFCIAVGFYAFTQLDMTKRNREVNLYSLIPSNCTGVLESNQTTALLNDLSSLNYHKELVQFQFPGLFEFLLHHLNEYAVNNAHGLSSQMNHLMVSFHQPGTNRDQVVYFRTGESDIQLFEDMIQEYAPVNFLPKEETYQGKTITVYPLGQDEFLAAYMGDGYMALSFQKRLIEEVIDAQQDKKSLNEDPVFAQILQKKKSHSSLTLYGRSASFPFLKLNQSCWSEYEFHLNSDVLYLTGETYLPDSCLSLSDIEQPILGQNSVYEKDWLLSTHRDTTSVFMEKTHHLMEDGERSLFNQCVANLSKDAVYTMVVDMERVVENSELFAGCLPSLLLNHATLLRSFIVSAQLSLTQNRPSHVWVLTYKN